LTLHELGTLLGCTRLWDQGLKNRPVLLTPGDSSFFPPLKKDDTEYGIGWLPLGGYVKNLKGG
jgi:hypothetical protein